MPNRLKCVRCSAPITEIECVVTPEGDLFHRQCWRVTAVDDQVRAARALIAKTQDLIRASRALLDAKDAAAEPSPICAVCLQPIEASDLVAGQSPSLIHQRCDGSRPPASPR